MNSVIGRELGLTPARAKWVYSAIIKPKLTYGCVVWAHAVTKSNEKKLDRLQRRALIHMIRPSFSSTPTKGMEVLFSLPPLLLSVEELALNAANRLGRPNMSWTGSGSKVDKVGHLKSRWD